MFILCSLWTDLLDTTMVKPAKREILGLREGAQQFILVKDQAYYGTLMDTDSFLLLSDKSKQSRPKEAMLVSYTIQTLK